MNTEGVLEVTGTDVPLLPEVHDWSGLSLQAPIDMDGRVLSFARLATENPWVGVCINRMLTWAARVPLKGFVRLGDGSRARLRGADGDRLAMGLESPWPLGTPIAMVGHALGSLLVHGNGVLEVDVSASGLSFTPHDWRRTRAIMADKRDPWSPVVGWQITTPGGVRREVAAGDVCHFGWWSPLGRLGVSPLQQLGVTLRGEERAREWSEKSLLNAAYPSGVVQLSKEFVGIEPEARQQLVAETTRTVRSIYAGAANARKLAVLPPGVEWQDIKAGGTTAVEAQLVEQRRLNRDEVAAIYQIPPPMIGIYDHASFNNFREAREIALTDGLAPPLIMIEQVLNAVVCRHLLARDDAYVEFDFAGILRGDRLREVEAVREAIGTAVLTPNEGRELMNRPRDPSDAADLLYLPMNNLQPLSSVDAVPPTPSEV